MLMQDHIGRHIQEILYLEANDDIIKTFSVD